MRTGAHFGLRCGVFGFAAATLLTFGHVALAAPYADIVIDANSGTVLHATNPDAQRHPASLTKIMTLYLLFEQLEAGKLKLDTPLKVSQEAAGQSPTKLGLRPGTTLAVEDAIKGMVTRSANDAAVVVAEAIAGDEDEFAKLMTRKARALGMTRTVYKNASGLPDDNQVTTARDQSILGRAVQERFPRYYKYFSIRSFTFRGQSIANHNRLLGNVEGVDGIKTGYIGASGFNLVTSVHRGNRYLVAVVMGGSSAGSRDARMRELISEKIAMASTKRTAPTVAEGAEPGAASEPKVAAKVEPKPAPKPEAVAKVEPKPTPKPESGKPETSAEAKTAEAKTESRFAVASAVSVPMRFTPPSAPAQPAVQPVAAAQPAPPRSEPSTNGATARTMAGSTEPIRPVLVKTVSVRAITRTASLASMHVAAAASEPQPTPVPAAIPAPAMTPSAAPVQTAAAVAAPAPSVAKPEPLPPQSSAAALPPASAQPAPPAASPAAPAQATSTPSAPSPAATTAKAQSTTKKPTAHSGWIIQVGAYPAEREAKQRLSAVKSKAGKILTGADSFTEPVEKGGTIYYRARFAGFDKDKAEAACKYLKRNDVECVTLKN
jgi:D-alanyl-D-alanine carboxypeptidase